MAFHAWQVGLDIQNGSLYALAVQRRRRGWQLYHWWHKQLPQNTLIQGVLQNSPKLSALLAQWRRQLPQRISLRIALSPRLVMQRSLPSGDNSLREPELNGYIQAAARRLFPIQPELLSLDYQPQAEGWQITAIRTSVLEQWLAPLRQAGLEPQVVELGSGALSVMADMLAMPSHAVWVHQLPDGWLWYAPSLSPASGWAEADLTLDALQARYFPLAQPVWLSGAPCSGRQDPVVTPNLHQLFHFLQPPLPPRLDAFALACGLALRGEDV